MNFLCNEKVKVYIEKHPYHESINKKILEESLYFSYSSGQLNRDGGVSNVKAKKTEGRRISSKSIEIIYEWVLNIVNNDFRNWKFVVDNAWMASYNEGEFTVAHNHRPAAFSFVYFIKCPKGSAPLVLTTSGKRIKAEEGKLVLFPGNMIHHVPKNKCHGRMVLAGNIFTFSDL